MNIILFLCSFTFLTLSCNNKVYINFKIKNETQFILKSIIVKASGGSEKYGMDLDPERTMKLKLDMTNIPKSDGNYSIEFNIKDSSIVHHFGYFTNGCPINNLYQITIQADTIIIKEDY